MKHISLAFAGVVAGSMALSAQAGTTEWWAEDFSGYSLDITQMTNRLVKAGIWEMQEGDTSSLAGSYSNDCATAIAPTVPSDVLVLNTEGNELTFAPTNATTSADVTVVDADVFFVGSDTEPNLSEDTTVQFALFLKVPEDTGANDVSNAVMVYVRDGGSAGWVELDDTDIDDKTWHHVQVRINYASVNRTAEVWIDGDQKTPDGGYMIANNVQTATGLNSVSFKGTGAVDNFTGGFEVAEDIPLHTFTATAYVDGVVTNDFIADAEDVEAGQDAGFEFAKVVDGKPIERVVVYDFVGSSNITYLASDSFAGLAIDLESDPNNALVTISTVGTATTGSAQTYPALEVYYASTVVPPTTYSASITLPAGCILTGVTTNGTPVTPATTTIEGLDDGVEVAFTYENADGVSKTATVTIDGANGEATLAPYTWADYLGTAVDGAYEIDNLAELKLFQKGIPSSTNEVKLATAGETFKLTADIALDAPWPGIGVQNGKDIYSTADFNAAAFQGTFDGQNHTISGFQMVGVAGNPKNNGEGLDYCGFFNSTYGATIQNLKIAYAGSLFAADTTASTKESGATFVGVAKNSTLRNLTTVAGTVSCSKGFGGIVGYLTSGTSVDSCTNNLNMTSLAGNKCGGIAMIAQGGSAVTISNCQNNGTQTTTSSNSEYGAIVGYVGLDITIANCETTVGRFLKHQGNTVTLQGVNKGDATVASYHGAATPDLNFATVDDNVATFVADNALAAGNTYKVMGPSATATYEFAAAGSISFDTNLVQAVTFNITVAQGLKDPPTETTADGVVTFTARALATPTVTVNGGANATAAWTVNGTPAAEAPATLTEGDTYEVVYTANSGYEFAEGATTNATGTAGTENIVITISDAVASAQEPIEIAPETLGDEVYTTEADAQAAAANVSVGASAAVTAALDATELEAYKAMFEIKPAQDNNEWKLTAALTDTAKAALTTEATDDAGDLVTAGFTGTVEVDATPGFYYSIVWGTGVTNLGNETARVLADGDKVTLTFPENTANSGFYKVKISVVPSASN